MINLFYKQDFCANVWTKTIGDELDYDKEWGILDNAALQIHTKNASVLSYEVLYRTAYKIVLKKQGDKLYNDVCRWVQKWLEEEVCEGKLLRVFSANLYSVSHIANAGASEAEKRVAGEKILRAMNEAFQDHQTCMAMLADVLMYMVLPPISAASPQLS
jgi:cullin 3